MEDEQGGFRGGLCKWCRTYFNPGPVGSGVHSCTRTDAVLSPDEVLGLLAARPCVCDRIPNLKLRPCWPCEARADLATRVV